MELNRRGFLGWSAVGLAGLLVPELVLPKRTVVAVGWAPAPRLIVRRATLDGELLDLGRIEVVAGKSAHFPGHWRHQILLKNPVSNDFATLAVFDSKLGDQEVLVDASTWGGSSLFTL